jgi:hypothetical protein
MKVQYSINDGLEMHFFVPGRRETMRVAAYSVRSSSPSLLGAGLRASIHPRSAMGLAPV